MPTSVGLERSCLALKELFVPDGPLMYPPANRLIITIGILVGMFLAALEATVVGTAMPTVVASLGGLDIYSWVFSAYLLASTVTVPAWGKLSDIYGRRPFYLLAISLFLLGSILSGQAQSMVQLIVFRTIQGLGAGGLLPLAMTIIAELYTPVERTRVQGYFSGVWGLASIAGPLVGGVITDQLSWRWVFYLNIPFGLVAALIIGTQLVEDRSRLHRRKIDVSGIVLFTVSITLFMLLLVRSSDSFDLTTPSSLFLIAGSFLTLVLFLVVERKAQEPLIPIELFRNKVFTGSSINGFLSGMAMFGVISFIPLFVQGVLGTGATEAGSVLTPLLMGWVVFSIVGARLLLRVRFRTMMFVGMVLMVLGFGLLDLMDSDTTRITVLRNVGLIGSGMGLVMITSLIAVQSSVSREQLGIATSTAQFFRSIGGAIGVAIMGTVMAQRMNAQMVQMTSNSGGGADVGELQQLVQNPDAFLQPAARQLLAPEMVEAFQSMLANALPTTFVIGTVVSVLALLSLALMPPVQLKRTGTPE